MPTYELTCSDCGHRFDRFLTRLLRADDKVCPRCGSRNVQLGVGGGFPFRSASSSSECAPRGGFG